MSVSASIAELASEHGEALFGAAVNAGSLRVTPVARESRHIYRVEARTRGRTAIAKVRPFKTDVERKTAQVETENEFAVLLSVWKGLRDLAPPEFRVPRPLLTLPGLGLLFMEQCPGQSLDRSLRWWVLGLRSSRDVSEQVRRCGEWLRALTRITSSIAWPAVDPEQDAILRARRSRHHVYSLIGLDGAMLAERMACEARRRLEAYAADRCFSRRVELAIREQLAHSGLLVEGHQAIHGKYSPADLIVDSTSVAAVDLEQAGLGSPYLDVAYFLYQLQMAARWRVFASASTGVRELRASFMRGRSPSGDMDDSVLDCFVAYYLVNSLRPGNGLAGQGARACASQWLHQWLKRSGR